MKNDIKLPIENTMYYSFDKVSCFEQPIGNLLNYQNGYYGHAFIMLSKIFQFYFLKPECVFRLELSKLINDILEIQTIEINSTHQILKETKRALAEQRPLIIGINCKKLFYSDHYQIEDWPHWMLITGYNSQTKIIQVIDDLHLLYCNRENEYSHFNLSFSIIKSISNSYLKTYGKKWSCFNLKINNKRSLIEVLISIIKYYSQFDFQSNSFVQLRLLKEYINCENEILKEEIKKKIINTNKYRVVFIELIKKYMIELKYHEDGIQLFDNLNLELKKLWSNYTLINLSNIDNYKSNYSPLPDRILELEIKTKEVILDFREYLKLEDSKNKSKKYICLNPNLQIENDPDNVISITQNLIRFSFVRKKFYNWWYDDDAPKVILFSGIHANDSIKAVTEIEIRSDYLETNFQAGIFLRTPTETIFASIDVNDLFVLDKVGFINNSCKFDFQTKIKIVLMLKQKSITAQIFGDKTSSQIEWSLKSDENIDVGLACKTWGNGERLEVRFLNYEVKKEVENDGK